MSERSWFAVAPFVLAIGISSASLFLLQPMCARMVLPYLGGSPSVWTTCMLFFQAGLLGGYLYAHALSRIGLRTHILVHAAVLAVACAFLPPFIAPPSGTENTQSPTLWLLTSLFAAIGLPYLVLASTAPLLQLWFARLGLPGKRDPYFLYAASNSGSLIGLVAYLFVLEPLIGVRQQTYVWAGGFALFVALTAACCLIARNQRRAEPLRLAEKAPRRRRAKKPQAPSRRLIATWLFLAFVPSSLLLSVTVHLTADVASVPFLWVVPLAVYLMTYVLAFSPSAGGTHHIWKRWLPLMVLVVAIVLLSEGTEPLGLIVFLHALGLFWMGMLSHGELACLRPPVAGLTTFYLCIAIGGAAGGVFNAVLAPLLFDRLVEYPIALILACFIPAIAGSRSAMPARPVSKWASDILLPILLGLLICGLIFVDRRAGFPAGPMSSALIFGLPLVVCYTFSGRPTRFALGIAALFSAGSLYPGIHGDPDLRVRSFFGVHRVTRDAHHRTLVHGNTVHGLQSLDSVARREPLAYYTRSGPVGDLLAVGSAARANFKDVAVLGLGAGALAAYAEAGENWDFYEIDPAVVQIARKEFTYLSDAISRGASVEITPGDARLQISRALQKYGLIILDAFSSDSIPTHLFTLEAFATYRERLTDDGAIVVHYSSRYFDLRPVLGGLASSSQSRWDVFYREDLWLTEQQRQAGKAPSKWAVFLQEPNGAAIQGLTRNGWLPLRGHGNPPLWTDDHANVLGALRLSPE